MSKTRNTEGREIAMGRIIVGGVLGMSLTLILTFAAAFALSRELFTPEACDWMGPLILAVSAFLCAWTAAAKNGKKLVCGMAAALLYGSALMIAGMLLFSSPMQTGRLAISVGSMLVGGLGGIFTAGLTD